MRRRVGERMISACVVPTGKHGGGGVMVWECITGDTVNDLLRIQGTLNQHGYHITLQRYAIPSGLRLVRLSFVFPQDNDPKHTSRLCKGYLIKWVMECCVRLPGLHNHPTSNQLRCFWMSWTSEPKAANKCSAYVGTPSRLLEKHSSNQIKFKKIMIRSKSNK